MVEIVFTSTRVRVLKFICVDREPEVSNLQKKIRNLLVERLLQRVHIDLVLQGGEV
jgi:hypothetical protein